MKRKIIPIILCGGKGTRLWPLSRNSYPKQFLAIINNSKKSLLQQTFDRISCLENVENPIIICNEEHRFLVAEQMRAIGINPKAIILEPEGKNTGPAIALGALKALEEERNSLLLVLSADHIIKNVNIFHQVLKKGFNYAEKDNLVTFGIVPTSPETGYGYIESVSVLDKDNIEGSRIKKFIEKPDSNLAKRLIKSNRFTWNSGMFIFKTQLILDEFKIHAPSILNTCKKAMRRSFKDIDFTRIDKSSFSNAPNLPFDVAVMEKTDNGIVIPLDAGWSDIGSWKSLWESEPKDKFNNVIKGKVINEQSSGCFLKSENRLLVALGLKDLIVIETPDAMLVSNKENINNLKRIVEDLEAKGYKESSLHQKIYRPWGSYISLIESKNWLVKKIEVNPESKLSLQMHHHRSEHWIVVKGTAEVKINSITKILVENESIYIPVTHKHRLSNPTKEPLILIEVQSGEHISEDDIVRFEDDYGR